MIDNFLKRWRVGLSQVSGHTASYFPKARLNFGSAAVQVFTASDMSLRTYFTTFKAQAAEKVWQS